MRIQPPIERVEVPAALPLHGGALFGDGFAKTAAGNGCCGGRFRRHRGFRYGHCPARLRRAVVLHLPHIGAYLPYAGAGRVFEAKRSGCCASLRRRHQTPHHCNLPPSGASRETAAGLFRPAPDFPAPCQPVRALAGTDLRQTRRRNLRV